MRQKLYCNAKCIYKYQAQIQSTQIHGYAVSGVGSSPALTTCETSQVLLAGVSGGFPGVLRFRPTYRFARLYG